MTWLAANKDALVAIASMIGAFSALGAWICTVWSDCRTERRFRALHRKIDARNID